MLAAPGVGRLDDRGTPEQRADSTLEHELATRYGLRVSVVVTVTPDGPLLAPVTLQTITELVDALRAVPGVSAVQSLLDAPLVRNVDGRLAALADNYRTLRRDDVDLERAWDELTNSPLYRDTLVSADGRRTMIEVVLAPLDPDSSLPTRLAFAVAARCPPCLPWLPPLQAFTHATPQRPTTLDAIATLLAQQPPTLHTGLSGAIVDAQARARALVDDLLSGTLLSTLLIVLVTACWLRDSRSFVVVVATTLASALFSASLVGWSGLALSNLAVVSVPLALAEAMLLHGRVLHAIVGEATGDVAASRGVRLSSVSRLSCAGVALMLAPFEDIASFGALLLIAAFSMLAFSLTLLPSLAVLLRPLPRRVLLTAPRVAPRWRTLLVAATLVGVSGIFMLEQSLETDTTPGITTNAGDAGRAGASDGNGELELHVLLAFPPATPVVVMDDIDDELLAAIEHDNTHADNWFTPTIVERITAVHAAMEALPEQVYVRSLASTLRVARQLNGGIDFNAFDLNLIHRRLPRAVRAAVVEPYVAIAANEARVFVRLAPAQTAPDALLTRVRAALDDELGLRPADYRLAGTLVSAADYRARLVACFAWVCVTVLVLQTTLLLALWRHQRHSVCVAELRALLPLAPGVVGLALALGLFGWAGLAVSSMTIAAAASALGLTLHTDEAQAAGYSLLLIALACLSVLGTPIAALADFCVLVAVTATAGGLFRVTFMPASIAPRHTSHGVSGPAY